MEMLATASSIRTAQAAAGSRVTEAAVDELSQRNFLDHIALSNVINIVPFALIALCCIYLPDWRLMGILLGLNAMTMVAMFVVCRLLRNAEAPASRQTLWRVYEGAAFLSGALWAAKMSPVVATLGRDLASMFVCVVIIVSIAITCMVVASQWRTFLSFLAGVMLCLTPQTLMYIDVVGPIPLVATIGLAPALIGLAHAIRKQNRLVVRTQLEKENLAGDLAHALAVAEYLASRDSLTGLYNRRAFEDLANRAQDDAAAQPLSLILIDLDHFKSINDQHGHAIGDSVLQSAATFIASAVGPFDLVGRGDGTVARWGGEEFILLLRSTPPEKAAQLAETLRQGLVELRDAGWPADLFVTASLGVAGWPKGEALHLAISQADTAMYQAKNAGRNRICVFSESDDPLSVEAA